MVGQMGKETYHCKVKVSLFGCVNCKSTGIERQV